MALTRRGMIAGALAGLGWTARAGAQTVRIEGFRMQADAGWRLITDQVMGGVSTGQVTFGSEDGIPHARLSGRVSTENRGGFIQMRLDLETPPPSEARGVRLVARGNDQRYFVHLRTSGTLLPWQYYQAGFEVTRDWAEVFLPFEAFAPSGSLLRSVPRADSVKSVAVVAYGRDHAAEIEVREIGFV